MEKTLVKDVQWDTFSTHVLHIDFVRVDPDERVRVEVPVQLRGTAPGIVAGGALEQPNHSVEVECLVVEVPDAIQVRINTLQIGDYIHVSDLTELPEGVTITTSPETVLAHIVDMKAAAAAAEAADEAAAAAAAAEQEVEAPEGGADE